MTENTAHFNRFVIPPCRHRRSFNPLGVVITLPLLMVILALPAPSTRAATAYDSDNLYINVQDSAFGATGDGTTDDTTAIQDAIESIGNNFDASAKGATVFFPRGKYRITDTIEVPPGIRLLGVGLYNGTNMPDDGASVIFVDHNGVGVRFVRTITGTGLLTHNGGAQNMVFHGLGSSGGNQHLIELGDSTAVNTSNGAWNGLIRNCAFNYTHGYGIYSAHSQEWQVEQCYFRSVKYGAWWNTVAASAKLLNNSFDDSSHISGSIAIYMRLGSLGGATAPVIANNYVIAYNQGIRLVSIDGAIVTGNVLEGIREESILLTKYTASGSADGSGCRGFHIEANSFINWSANLSNNSHSAIQVSFSGNGYIGHNYFVAPDGDASHAVNFYDGGDGTCDDIILVYPKIVGVNSTGPNAVSPLPSGNGIVAKLTILGYQTIKLADVAADTTDWSASDAGTLHLDDDGNLSMWDGVQTDHFLQNKSTSTTATGGTRTVPTLAEGFVVVSIGGTNYKIPYYKN